MQPFYRSVLSMSEGFELFFTLATFFWVVLIGLLLAFTIGQDDE